MSNFGRYATWYDLLYADKDYEGEAHYVAGLLAANGVADGEILEFGCGTGRHALALSRMGYQVTGVDLSASMIAQAKARPVAASEAVSFETGDLRTYRAGRTFAGVLSLFHTINYQTAEADLTATFASAAEHLRPGGVFVFDCWYGPGVLATPPAVRVRRVNDEKTEVFRFSEPTIRADDNQVDVAFTLIARDLSTGVAEVIRETHTIRYLFGPEVRRLAADCGLELVSRLPWMSDVPLDERAWQAVFVARRPD